MPDTFEISDQQSRFDSCHRGAGAFREATERFQAEATERRQARQTEKQQAPPESSTSNPSADTGTVNKASTTQPESTTSKAPVNTGKGSGDGFDAAHKEKAAKHLKEMRQEACRLSVQFSGREVPCAYRDKFIIEALRLSGHHATPVEIKYARALVNQESSFHAGQVNRWDSNAAAGYPSKGWAQVINPTFQHYRVRGHGDIWNPIDNLVAGIRYADARYGNLDCDHNGLRWVAIHRSMRHLGY